MKTAIIAAIVFINAVTPLDVGFAVSKEQRFGQEVKAPERETLTIYVNQKIIFQKSL